MQTVKSHYDMIIGLDLLEQLPLDIKFSDRTLSWQEVTIPMKTMEELNKQNIDEIVKQCYESVHLGEITQKTTDILDIGCDKFDLSTTVFKCTYLSKRGKKCSTPQATT
jgi:hypothetical protein